MKPTRKTTHDTSFHNDAFYASVADLTQICGAPTFKNNSGFKKINFEWVMETENGDVFTIYDWKEYRRISEYERIEWHIGGNNGDVTYTALNEIADALNNIDSLENI